MQSTLSQELSGYNNAGALKKLFQGFLDSLTVRNYLNVTVTSLSTTTTPPAVPVQPVADSNAVSYTSASYIGPLAAAVTLALVAAAVGAVLYRRRVYKAKQELAREKIRMSDSSRRIDLSKGITYGGSNPLAASGVSGNQLATASAIMSSASMRNMVRSTSMRDGKAQAYIGGSREPVQQAAYSPQNVGVGRPRKPSNTSTVTNNPASRFNTSNKPGSRSSIDRSNSLIKSNSRRGDDEE